MDTTRPEPTPMKLPNTPPLRNGELTAAFRGEGISRPRRRPPRPRSRWFEENDENERRNSFDARYSMFPVRGGLTHALQTNRKGETMRKIKTGTWKVSGSR